MIVNKLAVAVGYAKAPRATFVLRHPKTGTAAVALSRVLRESPTARRVAAGLVGLGAALVAVPAFTVWALRR